MTEHQYRNQYGDTDDAAKFYRAEDPKRCPECGGFKNYEDIKDKLCDDCLNNPNVSINTEI